MIGIIDVGGFDFAHPDSSTEHGTRGSSPSGTRAATSAEPPERLRLRRGVHASRS